MHSSAALSFTRNLFMVDAVINWVIGAGSLVLPHSVERVLFTRSFIPSIWINVLGAGFLLFAFWQTVTIARDMVIEPSVMAFAALMAVLPALFLGGALLFLRLPLHPLSRAVLWIGEVYMLALGALYAAIYRGLRAPSQER